MPSPPPSLASCDSTVYTLHHHYVIHTMGLHHSSDDVQKASTLQLLAGYLQLLGPHTLTLTHSHAHLSRITQALVQVVLSWYREPMSFISTCIAVCTSNHPFIPRLWNWMPVTLTLWRRSPLRTRVLTNSTSHSTPRGRVKMEQYPPAPGGPRETVHGGPSPCTTNNSDCLKWRL